MVRLAEFAWMLDALSWPIAALILGVAAVHCCRLLVTAFVDEFERWRKSQFELALLIQDRKASNAVTVARLGQPPTPIPRDVNEERVIRTSESALLALLAANGAFLGRPEDHVVRQIVREVREMYSEINNPTPVSEVAKSRLHAGADDGADDLTLDEVYDGYNSTSYHDPEEEPEEDI